MKPENMIEYLIGNMTPDFYRKHKERLDKLWWFIEIEECETHFNKGKINGNKETV